jgi:hypothetical protein
VDLRSSQVVFFKKFAHLYDSGVPLADAIDLVGRDLPGPLRAAVAGIVDDIYRGISLADALAARGALFSAEVLGVIRAGETRGELGEAARAAARGLEGRVLEAAAVSEDAVDELLANAGDARVVHLDPDGLVRVRRGGRLEELGSAETLGLIAGLARRAQLEEDVGSGAFLWRDHLVRIAVARSDGGPAAVVRISSPPGPEPLEAAAWRRGPPGLLLVCGDRHADADSVLRSILRAFDPAATRRVAIDLPAPEALHVSSLGAALGLDPDVICLARARSEEDCARLAGAAAQGIHTVAAVLAPELAAGLPHALVQLD